MGSSNDSESVPIISNQEIRRHHFPSGFVFGCATSAYQVEGAHTKGGRSHSIWDVYSNGHPANIRDGSNGNVAADMYNRYKEDIKMMRRMGFDAYRFSISWSRILPGGKLSLGINEEGIAYYNDLINTIIDNGMKPYVTIFHWDLPYSLEQEYRGFLSPKIIDDFRDYAELCFLEFGDRVRHWITFNEAWTYCAHGYAADRLFPPGNGFFGPQYDQQSYPGPAAATTLSDDEEEEEEEDEGQNFIPYRGATVDTQSSSSGVRRKPIMRLPAPMSNTDNVVCNNYILEKAKEAYTAGRNMLLAHAAAVQSYRLRFQDTQEDQAAARRAFDFMLGWFLEPVLTGQYPQSMLTAATKWLLTPFTPEESDLLKGSVDFLGVNYYTTWYATHDPNPKADEGYYNDQKVEFKHARKGVPIGDSTGSKWLYIVPSGFHKLLKFINDTFNIENNLPPIYITENGCDQKNDPKQTPYEACNDSQRVKYFQDHLAMLLKTIKEEKKLKIEAYFAWSFCDNFEWYDGYNSRFGIIYIDFKNDLKRYRKDSAMWFTRFLLKRNEPRDVEENMEKEKQAS